MAIVCLPYLSTWRLVLAADAGGSEGLMQFVILFVPLFVIWYFLVIRPQQSQRKKTQEMLGSLKTGDRVLTSGGIYGTIVSFRDNSVVQLQIANQVKVDVTRSAITGVQPHDSETNAAGRDSGKKEASAKGKN